MQIVWVDLKDIKIGIGKKTWDLLRVDDFNELFKVLG